MHLQIGRFLPILALATTSACRSGLRAFDAAAPVTGQVCEEIDTTKCSRARDVMPNYERTAYLVRSKAGINITTAARAQRNALKVSVSNGPYGRGGYSDRPIPNDPVAGEYRYQLSLNRDLGGGFSHNQVIRVQVTPPGSQTTHDFYLQHQQPVAFSGFSAPILLRVTGNAGAFQLENLAPSLASGIRFNTGRNSVPYVALNALGTVLTTPASAERPATTFAAAVGAVTDVSGVLQVGWTYSFKAKQGYMVLGLRPELLYRLTAGAFGKE